MCVIGLERVKPLLSLKKINMKSGKKILGRLQTGGVFIVTALALIIALLISKCSGDVSKEIVSVDTVINNVFVFDTIILKDTVIQYQTKYKEKKIKEFIYELCDQVVDENAIRKHLLDSLDIDKLIKTTNASVSGDNYTIDSKYKYIGEFLSAEHVVEVEQLETIKEIEKTITKEVILKQKLGLYGGAGVSFNNGEVNDYSVLLNLGNEKFQIGVSKSLKEAEQFQLNLTHRLGKSKYK
jgi:hypothetical protein